jgi:hypothetical protein
MTGESEVDCHEGFFWITSALPTTIQESSERTDALPVKFIMACVDPVNFLGQRDLGDPSNQTVVDSA